MRSKVDELQREVAKVTAEVHELRSKYDDKSRQKRKLEELYGDLKGKGSVTPTQSSTSRFSHSQNGGFLNRPHINLPNIHQNRQSLLPAPLAPPPSLASSRLSSPSPATRITSPSPAASFSHQPNSSPYMARRQSPAPPRSPQLEVRASVQNSPLSSSQSSNDRKKVAQFTSKSWLNISFSRVLGSQRTIKANIRCRRRKPRSSSTRCNGQTATAVRTQSAHDSTFE